MNPRRLSLIGILIVFALALGFFTQDDLLQYVDALNSWTPQQAVVTVKQVTMLERSGLVGPRTQTTRYLRCKIPSMSQTLEPNGCRVAVGWLAWRQAKSGDPIEVLVSNDTPPRYSIKTVYMTSFIGDTLPIAVGSLLLLLYWLSWMKRRQGLKARAKNAQS